MNIKKSIRGLSCILLLGLNAQVLKASPQLELSRPKITYNFDEFFSRQLPQQKSIESLITDSYIRYHSLIKDARDKNPGQTFTLQDLLDSSNIKDKGRFWGLALDYMGDLKRFGYEIEGFPEVERDFFKLNLIDRKKDFPYIKLEINMGSPLEYIDTKEIMNFLGDSRISFFLYDLEGNYLYGGFKYKK